jgi:hypothetical protein
MWLMMGFTKMTAVKRESCTVADDGYVWQTIEHRRCISPKGRGLHFYDAYTGLFLNFAELEPSEDKILKFANKYGLLRSFRCETLAEWENEIQRMRQAVSLWKEVAKADHITIWENKKIQDSAAQLESLANESLTANTHHGLTWVKDVFIFASQSINLLGTMWTQLARAVAENIEYRQCMWCYRYFELSPGVNRADRKYCSNSCRASAGRKRMKERK